MGELSLRDAEQLSLATGDLTVEFGVAEQRRTHPLIADLGGLTLCKQLLVTHVATAAGDLKRDDDSVADSEVGDGGPNLTNDAHRFVTEDVSGVHEGAKDLVEVKVDRTVLVDGMSAVVDGATVRVTEQGIGLQDLPQPLVGFYVRFPGAYVGVMVA